LPLLRESNDSPALSFVAGGHGGISAQEILQSAMHEAGLCRDENTQCNQQSEAVGKGKASAMPVMPVNSLASCTSPGREPSQQSINQPSDSLLLVPPKGSPAARRGCQRCEHLHRLREKIATAKNVPEALSAVEEIRKSVIDQDTIAGNEIPIHTPTSTIAIDWDLFPLAPPTKGRNMLLKGSGNAIVPQVAAMFLRAVIGNEGEQQ
jgi:hypothetical protein